MKKVFLINMFYFLIDNIFAQDFFALMTWNRLQRRSQSIFEYIIEIAISHIFIIKVFAFNLTRIYTLRLCLCDLSQKSFKKSYAKPPVDSHENFSHYCKMYSYIELDSFQIKHKYSRLTNLVYSSSFQCEGWCTTDYCLKYKGILCF